MLQSQVYFKHDKLQEVDPLKFRGAYVAIANLKDPQKGVAVFSSSGDHAMAVALAATLNNVSSTIFMPKDAPEMKVNIAKNYGGTVI